MSSIEVPIPLDDFWVPETADCRGCIKYYDLDRYEEKNCQLARVVARRTLKTFLEKPEYIQDALTTLQEHLQDVVNHGEPPKLGRLILLNEAAVIDTKNKIKTDDHQGQQVGRIIQLSNVGKSCVDSSTSGEWYYRRTIISKDFPEGATPQPIPEWYWDDDNNLVQRTGTD